MAAHNKEQVLIESLKLMALTRLILRHRCTAILRKNLYSQILN